jgi:hypothetical protein
MVTWPSALEQNIMVVEAGQMAWNFFTSFINWKQTEGLQEGAWARKSASDTDPVTFFLQLGPTPLCTSQYCRHFMKFRESTSGLSHPLGHSPQDLIVSGNAITDTPGVCITNLLGVSQSSQVDSQDEPSWVVAVPQVVGSLPSKCKAMSSNPSTAKISLSLHL